MSRSIHTTRRSLARLRKRKFVSAADREAAITKAEFDLRRKRRIKRQVTAERHAAAREGERTPAASIPIVVADEGPGIFHAVSPEDVRAVLGLLPPAAVQGIGEVRLALGREYMLEHVSQGKGTTGTPDPLTGRPGSELFPGVYSGPVLGTYFSAKGLIALYAYVVDRERLLVPRAIVGLYLRLQALKTLMHEIAHFHDETARVRRGRWLADRHENLEWYAEKMEHEWTGQIVIPYLERRYAGECRVFQAWMRQRGGIGLPVGFFAGDPRDTQRNGLVRLASPTSGAFEQWLEELPGCGTRHDAALSLAWRLHYADHYEECLTLLNAILGQDAKHVNARECRADTLVHLERFDEAFADAEEVIRIAPKVCRAWEALAEVLVHRKEWAGLIESCRRWGLVRQVSPRKRRDCWYYRAIAYCALDDLAGMETNLAAYAATLRSRDPEASARRMRALRRGVFRRVGKPLPEDPLK